MSELPSEIKPEFPSRGRQTERKNFP